MLKIIRIFTVMVLAIESSMTSALNQTAEHSPSENVTIVLLPSNHKNTSELLDKDSFTVNSSLKVAESRQFPVGSPDLIPSSQNLISPFDVGSFSKQLLPLINVNIKEKVKNFAKTFNDGADFIEDTIRESWRESPLNPHNFASILDSKPNLFKHLPFNPNPNGLRKPIQVAPKAQGKHKVKAPKAIESYSVDNMMHDYGINGYKHFENSILRELEKQEELKVEATIHTLFEHDDDRKHGHRVIEIVQGKPYDFKSGWKPVAAPTKTYDDGSDNSINSQIISPLHTSFSASSSAPHGFHDFDDQNSISSSYNVHEEGESKVKPVKAKINSGRRVTPSPVSGSTTEKSRYRKRHNVKVVKPDVVETVTASDLGASGSHDAPQVIKSKRTLQRHHHIQSLTTSKPRNHVTTSRSLVTDAPTVDASSQNVLRPAHQTAEIPSRIRSWSSSSSTSTTTTTIRPSRHVQREASKFVDKPKATGYRGSVKFGQKPI